MLMTMIYFPPQVSESNPAVLFVGARLVRSFRFVGEIQAVVVFNFLLSSTNILALHNEYTQVLDPLGDCMPYLALGDNCPTPTMASSLLCQSVSQL